MHEKLGALVARDLARAVDGLPLGPVNRRGTLATGTTHGPPILMWDNMLITFPHFNLLLYYGYLMPLTLKLSVDGVSDVIYILYIK